MRGDVENSKTTTRKASAPAKTGETRAEGKAMRE
jgi:hypothetical protein